MRRHTIRRIQEREWEAWCQHNRSHARPRSSRLSGRLRSINAHVFATSDKVATVHTTSAVDKFIRSLHRESLTHGNNYNKNYKADLIGGSPFFVRRRISTRWSRALFLVLVLYHKATTNKQQSIHDGTYRTYRTYVRTVSLFIRAYFGITIYNKNHSYEYDSYEYSGVREAL